MNRFESTLTQIHTKCEIKRKELLIVKIAVVWSVDGGTLRGNNIP